MIIMILFVIKNIQSNTADNNDGSILDGNYDDNDDEGDSGGFDGEIKFMMAQQMVMMIMKVLLVLNDIQRMILPKMKIHIQLLQDTYKQIDKAIRQKVLYSNYSCILRISIQIEYDASDYNVGAVDHDHSYDDDDDDDNKLYLWEH